MGTVGDRGRKSGNFLMKIRGIPRRGKTLPKLDTSTASSCVHSDVRTELFSTKTQKTTTSSCRRSHTKCLVRPNTRALERQKDLWKPASSEVHRIGASLGKALHPVPELEDHHSSPSKDFSCHPGNGTQNYRKTHSEKLFNATQRNAKHHNTSFSQCLSARMAPVAQVPRTGLCSP